MFTNVLKLLNNLIGFFSVFFIFRCKIELGDVTPHNIKQLKKLNTVVFPVSYNDKFYKDVLEAGELAKLGKYVICSVSLWFYLWFLQLLYFFRFFIIIFLSNITFLVFTNNVILQLIAKLRAQHSTNRSTRQPLNLINFVIFLKSIACLKFYKSKFKKKKKL